MTTQSVRFPLAFALACRIAVPQAIAPTRIVSVDFSRVQGPHNTAYRKCIGAGRANEGLRADWQQQLAEVQRDIGFEYIRMHGLLHDDMGVYQEDRAGNPVYNWQYIDRLYDALLAVQIRPFVELSFMPHALASGDKTVFWWHGNITPPKSYEKWAALIRALTVHFRDRYGEDEVRHWYFEVWNEPDISPFWTGTFEDYCKLYRVTAEAVKSVSPEFRVGGPASAMPFRFEKELVAYCAANHIPIDFVSTHAYGVNEGFFDANGTRGTVLDGDPTAVRSRMLESRRLLAASALPKLELHFTEWSSAYTPTDFIHDQYHQAPFILDKVKGVEGAVDSLSYWVFTDIFEENGPRATPFHGGFGLLNYQGIKKPAYYAYQFMRQLGDVDLAGAGDAGWVTKDARGGVQALVWDFTPIVPPNGVNDQDFYRAARPAAGKGTLELRIANLPQGRYWMRVYRTGYRVNDAYTTYLEMGAPAQLSRQQVEAIQQANDGSPVSSGAIEHSGGMFSKILDWHENDVALVLLDRM